MALNASKRRLLWTGAAVTAAAAIFFPRIQGIRADENESWWRLLIFFIPQDLEGVILVPLVVLLTVALFALLGRWACNDTSRRNRPAKVGLATSLVAIVGVLAFFLSAPIVLGGLGVTLGIEGRRRAETEGRGGLAVAALGVGIVATAIGAAIWTFSEELSI